MKNLISKRRKWRFLKLGYKRFRSEFKSIKVSNVEKQDIDQLFYKAAIENQHVHCVKQVNYNIPNTISENEIANRMIEIDLDESWIIYFFDDVDWAQIQLLR